MLTNLGVGAMVLSGEMGWINPDDVHAIKVMTIILKYDYCCRFVCSFWKRAQLPKTNKEPQGPISNISG